MTILMNLLDDTPLGAEAHAGSKRVRIKRAWDMDRLEDRHCGDPSSMIGGADVWRIGLVLDVLDHQPYKTSRGSYTLLLMRIPSLRYGHTEWWCPASLFDHVA